MVQRAREELKQRHLQLLQQQEEERKRLALQEGEKKVEEDKATATGMSGGQSNSHGYGCLEDKAAAVGMNVWRAKQQPWVWMSGGQSNSHGSGVHSTCFNFYLHTSFI